MHKEHFSTRCTTQHTHGRPPPAKVAFGIEIGSGIAAISPNGRLVLSVHDDDNIRLWGTHDGICQRRLHSKETVVCCFSPDSQQILSSAKDLSSLMVWCVVTGRNLRVLDAGSGGIHSACFDASGENILACCNKLSFWSCATGARSNWKTHNSTSPCATGCCMSYDDQLCMTWRSELPGDYYNDNDFPMLWDPKTGECLNTLVGHCSGIIHGCFSPLNDTVLTASSDSTMKIWSLEMSSMGVRYSTTDERTFPINNGNKPGLLLHTLRVHGETHPHHKDFSVQIRRCGFSPSAEAVVSLDTSHTLKLWATSNGSLKASLGAVANFCFRPVGRAIAIVKTNGEVEVWGYQCS